MYKKVLGKRLHTEKVINHPKQKKWALIIWLIGLIVTYHLISSYFILKHSMIYTYIMILIIIITYVYPCYVLIKYKNYTFEVYDKGISILNNIKVTEILYEEIIAIKYVNRFGKQEQYVNFSEAKMLQLLAENNIIQNIELTNSELILWINDSYQNYLEGLSKRINRNNIVAQKIHFGQELLLENNILYFKNKINSEELQLKKIKDYQLNDNQLIIRLENRDYIINKNRIFNQELLLKILSIVSNESKEPL